MIFLRVIFEKILWLFLIMLVGLIAEKTGLIKGLKNMTSQLLTRITLPLLVITTLSNQAKNTETATTAMAVFVLGAVSVGILLFLGKLSAAPFRFSNKRANVHTCLTAFGNTIFLAYPLLDALWGQEAVFYAAFFTIANDLAAWTIGVLILSRTKNGKINFRRLLNPTTLSYFLGAFMFIFSLRLPPLLHDAAASIGGTTTVLSMLFLGAALASVKLRALFEALSSITIILIKMIIMPLGALFLLRWLIPALELPIHALAPSVIAMQIAMPCQSVFAVLAQEYGGDAEYAATAICITTGASLVTLPFIYTFMI